MAKELRLWPSIMDADQIHNSPGNDGCEQRFGYGARWDAQKRLLIAALSGKMSVETALSSLDTEINQAIQ